MSEIQKLIAPAAQRLTWTIGSTGVAGRAESETNVAGGNPVMQFVRELSPRSHMKPIDLIEHPEVSRLHRVQADEVWNLYQGDGVYLYIWDGTDCPPKQIELSAISNFFCHTVPAGYWQAAEPKAGTVLVGCSVGPGFEFKDFELIDPDSELAQLIQLDHPTLSKFTVL